MLCVTQTNKQHQFFGIFNYYYNKWFIAGLLLGQQKCRRRRNKTFLSTDNIACMKRFLLYFLQSNIYRLLSSWMFFKRHLGGEWGGSEERCCGRSSEEITQSIFFHIRLFVNPLYCLYRLKFSMPVYDSVAYWFSSFSLFIIFAWKQLT